jgi:hypothetical protein
LVLGRYSTLARRPAVGVVGMRYEKLWAGGEAIGFEALEDPVQDGGSSWNWIEALLILLDEGSRAIWIPGTIKEETPQREEKVEDDGTVTYLGRQAGWKERMVAAEEEEEEKKE